MAASPGAGVIPKGKGSGSTIAMAIVKPGIAPAISPAKVPTIMNMTVLTVASSCTAKRRFSKIIASTPSKQVVVQFAPGQNHAEREGKQAPHRADRTHGDDRVQHERSEEHTSELQSLMRNSYAVFCLKKKKKTTRHNKTSNS